jgi:hypothetical protein
MLCSGLRPVLDSFYFLRVWLNAIRGNKVPKELAERFKVIPVAETDGGLMIAVSNPLDFDTFDSLGHLLGSHGRTIRRMTGTGQTGEGADGSDEKGLTHPAGFCLVAFHSREQAFSSPDPALGT